MSRRFWLSDRGVLGFCTILAFLFPFAAHQYTHRQINRRVVPALSRALATDVRMSDVEVSLLGTLRVKDVEIRDVLWAKSVAASVSLGTLLDGSFTADEVAVESPRIKARIMPDGSLDIAQIINRVRAHKSRSSPPRAGRSRSTPEPHGEKKLRRIVVTGGDLLLDVQTLGEIRLREVELHPQSSGVRLVSRGLTLSLKGTTNKTNWQLWASVARVGIDVGIPSLRPGSIALADGEMTLAARGFPSMTLDELAVSRLLTGKDRREEQVRLAARLRGTADQVEVRTTRGKGGDARLELQAANLPVWPLGLALPESLQLLSGNVSGRVELGKHANETKLSISTAADLKAVELANATLAHKPITLNGKLTAQGDVNLSDGRADVAMSFAEGPLTVHASVNASWDAHGATLFSARLELPDSTCADALSALPTPMGERLAGMELDGLIGGSATIKVDPRRPEESGLDVDLNVRCLVAHDADIAPVPLLTRTFVHRLPNGKARELGQANPDYVPLAAIPRHVQGAFVAGEDARFYAHDGFDATQLRRSLAINVAAGKVERGGSTITQQLVKNLYLTGERTLSRKLAEAVLTWRVEQVVTKPRILEIYLNIIELGEGVYGVGSAARHWFGRDIHDLTVGQAAFLAAITPAPASTARRLHGRTTLDDETQERVRAVLRSMRRNRIIDEATFAREAFQPIRLASRP